MEILALLEDTLNPAARAASARAPSAATAMVEMYGASRRAEAPALVAEDSAVGDLAEEDAAGAADVTNQGFFVFSVARKLWKWREALCGERS
jgi:hypothetical protein